MLPFRQKRSSSPRSHPSAFTERRNVKIIWFTCKAYVYRPYIHFTNPVSFGRGCVECILIAFGILPAITMYALCLTCAVHFVANDILIRRSSSFTCRTVAIFVLFCEHVCIFPNSNPNPCDIFHVDVIRCNIHTAPAPGHIYLRHICVGILLARRDNNNMEFFLAWYRRHSVSKHDSDYDTNMFFWRLSLLQNMACNISMNDLCLLVYK